MNLFVFLGEWMPLPGVSILLKMAWLLVIEQMTFGIKWLVKSGLYFLSHKFLTIIRLGLSSMVSSTSDEISGLHQF